MSGNDFPKLGIKTADLIEYVEALIVQASKDKENMGAVNWGDIGVVDVEYRLSMIGNSEPWGVVIVEEANPGCELQAFLNDNLDKDRFPQTYVVCEW